MMNNGSLKVLLIEDNDNDEELLRLAIKSDGFDPVILRVDTEAATQVALNIRQEERWDLVLCDYLLPSFSANKALELVRESMGDIPFIVVSGLEDEETAVKMLKLGVNDFVFKSNLKRLPTAIRRELMAAGERMSSRIKVERAYLDIIEAWGSAMERRDVYTKDHTNRVTDLTLRLARALRVSGSEFRSIHYGALLHDIGKIGIPDAILLKRDPLDVSEMAIMKLHPVIAYEMLSKSEYLKEIINIPYCHHEKWDGTGYPRGLKGEAIPFEARLFSVVDVWDAITTDRPYRKPWPREKALEYLKEEKGKSFEPSIVDKFIEILSNGKYSK